MLRLLAFGSFIFFLLVGCTSVPCTSVDALYNSSEVILQDYREYVLADTTLDLNQQQNRLTHVAQHMALLNDLKALCGEEPAGTIPDQSGGGGGIPGPSPVVVE